VGEEAAGREIIGDHEPLGGFVKVDSIMEEFESDDLAGQAGAGG